jgi:hypothetical protein
LPGFPEEESPFFPRSGILFSHTSNPLSCWGLWFQIWHCTHILFTGQYWQVATHYWYMIPLQTRLLTVCTHFALPLNDSFRSIPSIFSPFWMLWICHYRHTQSVIFQTLNF